MKCMICQYGETEAGTTTVALTRDDAHIGSFAFAVLSNTVKVVSIGLIS